MTPSAPYAFDSVALTAALEEARIRVHRAEERRVRVACAIIAAAVGDILTEHHHDAAFDAHALRLTVNEYDRVTTDGTYWTASGQERRITDVLDLYGLDEWVHHLDRDNRSVWEPLCRYERTEGRTEYYRLDLAQAAALPAEIQSSARVTEIRDRLAASTRRPWSSEEYVYNGNGGLVSAGDPDAVHTDFVVSDADNIRVAEVAVNYGPEDTETPEEDTALSRANADLIARAPDDLAFLVAHLTHLCGGEDAEALNLRGSCGHCGTALYTSALEPTPAPLDSATACESRRLPGGRTLQLQHVLRT
ncbi:hypothetical protein ACFQ77_41085 [Streptomyces virginiae]|uniref:hypothetical protein n=1 Tax=Streptomyces virginiae TaxID=1961 RepID=UPI003676F8E3